MVTTQSFYFDSFIKKIPRENVTEMIRRQWWSDILSTDDQFTPYLLDVEASARSRRQFKASIYKYLSVVVVLGVLTNVSAVLFLITRNFCKLRCTGKRMSCTRNKNTSISFPFLLALNCGDFAALLLTASQLLIVRSSGWGKFGTVSSSNQLQYGQVSCKFLTYCGYIGSFLSPWIVCAITLDRMTAVCYPLRHTRLTKRGVWMVIGLIGIAANLHALLPTILATSSHNGYDCRLSSIGLKNIYEVINLIFLFILPGSGVVIFNICVAAALFRSLRNLRNAVTDSVRAEREKCSIRMARNLLLSSTIYLAFNSCYIARCMKMMFQLRIEQRVLSVFYALHTTQYAFNYIIYSRVMFLHHPLRFVKDSTMVVSNYLNTVAHNLSALLVPVIHENRLEVERVEETRVEETFV